MKKFEIVKEHYEFDNIINKGKSIGNKVFSIYFLKHDEEYPKFGIAVEKKIGNAVTRNKIKRRLKSIIDKKNYQNGFNCIIIVKGAINNYDYKSIEEKLLNALTELKIIEGEPNEK